MSPSFRARAGVLLSPTVSLDAGEWLIRTRKSMTPGYRASSSWLDQGGGMNTGRESAVKILCDEDAMAFESGC